MDQLPLFAPSSLSVSEITRYLRTLLESDEILQDTWVRGEISNLSRPGSGHIYFTLKDEFSALRCVIWKTAAMRLRIPLQNGLAVEAHGSIGVYERDGNYQLYVDSLRPAGEGFLYQEFLRLKARLEAEGLFDPERKRPIPLRPRVIGIVTSPTGAALQDMLNTLQRRYPLAEVVLAPAAVQGAAAPAELVRAIQRLNREHPDVILLARGGGSLEDLWAFNDEMVVRAVTQSATPVITGVGHETDFTLSDFAADLRAPTPTGAAVMATPDIADIRSELSQAINDLAGSLESILSDHRQQLDTARMQLQHASPLWQIRNNRQNLDTLSQRGISAVLHAAQLQRTRLNSFQNRLVSLSPLNVLQRGYAIISQADGQLVTRAGQVKKDQSLKVQMSDGSFGVTVNEPGV